ncbi:HAD family hydrolase [Marisediminicola sp. LYQ85]|uniref:HAD family hydrolase n=1 Tax=Marisediminicola sp. LYQ85 TaxID=3391062 RepID=UPI003983D1FC
MNFQTAPGASATRRLARRPDALLLDFGGVLFQTTKRPTGRRDAAELLHAELAAVGHDVSSAELHRALDAGLRALKDWKNSAGRRREPVELAPREIWTDFLASDLPDAVRATLAADAAGLLDRITPVLSDHEVRPGVVELLECAAELSIPVGIVSNAHSGRAHRALLERHGLSSHIGVQIYSDEVGMRKPHPGMVQLAATALGTTAERCWFVGDTVDRDVVAGRRASVGAVVLTRSQHTDEPPYSVDASADAVFATPLELVPVLAATVPDTTAERLPSTTGSESAVAVPAHVAAPRAILLDHGGVISTSVKDVAAQRRFGADIARRMREAGLSTDDAVMTSALETARFRHRQWKDGGEHSSRVLEITPREFWCEIVGAGLAAAERAWLRAEATELSYHYASVKSSTSIRPGVRDLLERARTAGIPVGIVSNTLSGRAVRRRLADADLGDLFAVQIYSDELGRRKPDRAMPDEAIAALGVHPEHCWFVGDKPDRDMVAAHAAGIPVAILVRGGSLDDATVDHAATLDGPERPDVVIDSIHELDRLLCEAISPGNPPSADTRRRQERALS